MSRSAQAKEIGRVLGRGRAGQATLVELATAHEAAEKAGLDGCATELRSHILTKISAPAAKRTVGRDLMLGMTTGALTHYLLRGV